MGLFSGTLKGMTGFFVKPLTGFFDATSKAAEGIKNTAMHFEDKPNEKRERPPRTFYNRERYFKSYS